MVTNPATIAVNARRSGAAEPALRLGTPHPRASTMTSPITKERRRALESSSSPVGRSDRGCGRTGTDSRPLTDSVRWETVAMVTTRCG